MNLTGLFRKEHVMNFQHLHDPHFLNRNLFDERDSHIMAIDRPLGLDSRIFR